MVSVLALQEIVFTWAAGVLSIVQGMFVDLWVLWGSLLFLHCTPRWECSSPATGSACMGAHVSVQAVSALFFNFLKTVTLIF